MNCCPDCFTDKEIQKIISRNDHYGTCECCGKERTRIHKATDNDSIGLVLNNIIELYVVADPVDGAKMLHQALKEDWEIFQIDQDRLMELVKHLCQTLYFDRQELFTNPVLIPQCTDMDYLKEFNITRGKSWREFAETIKFENRYFNDIFNKDALASFLTYSVKTYHAGTQMYRARICKEISGYPKEEVGAPPKDKRSGGRVNPEGVGILYLSSTRETALYEVRSAVHDFVTIGQFILKNDIKVVDLTHLNMISPVLFAEPEDLIRYAANQRCLKDIGNEISKPMRRSDSPLEYIPTQMISEFIKSANYAGVQYASTMTKDGVNLAVFDESCFECVSVSVCTIDELTYRYSEH